MKHILILLFTTISLSGICQSITPKGTIPSTLPGLSSYQNNTSKLLSDPNPTPQNGDGSLGQIYNFTKCGLNFTQDSKKLGRRFTDPCLSASLAQPVGFAISGIPSCAIIEKAYLWVEGSGGGIAQSADISGPFGSGNYPLILVGSGPDKCWGAWGYTGSHTYRADVTSIVGGNGIYNISGILTNPPNPLNDMDGGTLFVIYSDPTGVSQGTVVIHDGAVVIIGGSTTQQVNGFLSCQGITNATAFCTMGDMQCNVTGHNCTMNGVNAPFVPDWWNYVQVNTLLNPGQNVVNYVTTAFFDCYNLSMIGLYYQTNACGTCPQMTFNTSSTAAICNNCNGTATVTSVSNANPPYTYNWLPNGGTSATATGLCPGTYTVTVTENGGCISKSNVVTIGQVLSPLVLIGTETHVICNGNCSGTSTNTVSFGNPPYTFIWSPSITNSSTASTNNATLMCAGTYTLTVIDVNGCTATRSVTITQPSAIAATSTSISSTCDNSNGSATINPSGGTGPYNVIWTPTNQTTLTAINLSTGNYNCTITDADLCTYTTNVTVENVSSPTLSLLSSTNISCYGACDGTAIMTSINGTDPFTYSWIPSGGVMSTANELCPGTYTCTVTDFNLCTSNASVLITQPQQLTLSNTTATPSTICLGESVDLNGIANNGTLPYIYIWNPGSLVGASQHVWPQTTQTYTLAVLDANQCTDTSNVTVVVNPNPIPTLTGDNLTSCAPLCVNFSDSSTVAWGNMTAWDWDFGDGNKSGDQNPMHCYLEGGLYTVVLTVTTSEGCDSSITLPNYIMVNSLPIAAFSTSSQTPSDLYPVIEFINLSSNAIKWNWNFGDTANGSSTLRSPTYDYESTGCFDVKLTVTSSYDCIDIAQLQVCIGLEVSLFVPNAFTPNEDGTNDIFLAKGYNINSFNMDIFNRWGENIFQSNDINDGWNGTHENWECQEGVYAWIIKYSTLVEPKKENVVLGKVSIVR